MAVVIGAVLERITLAMVARFSASRFWDEARHYRVTHIHYLGGVLPMLLEQPPRADDRDHGVRVAWGGGCPPEIWTAFEARFGVEMREGYGLSELVTFVLVNPDGPEGSIGKPLPWYDIGIADADGTRSPRAKRARSSCTRTTSAWASSATSAMPRRPPQRGASVDGRRWFQTGDLGRRDADGWFYYAGRSKDSVRRRGINISAWEVERVINEHADVEESALVGVPGELGDDELLLYVRPAGGRTIDPRAGALVRAAAAALPDPALRRVRRRLSRARRRSASARASLSRDVTAAWDRGRRNRAP